MPDARSARRVFRTVAVYLALVGGPALGVAAALHVGQGLAAPPSVSGTWRVVPEDGGCARAAGVLRIDQSGDRVDAVYSTAEAGAMAIRGEVAGAQAALGDVGSCQRIEIAGVPPSGRANRLATTIQAGACGCRTTTATLVRVPDAPASGGH